MNNIYKLSTYKNAYYGYFLTIIRVEMYNKIILKNIINKRGKYSYTPNYILESNLKTEIHNDTQKNTFITFFELRKRIYERYWGKYKYTLEETIDLLYQYRNYLLDDQKRLEKNKLKNIINKTNNIKEREMQNIILLLLNEKILDQFASGFNKRNKNKILNYQKEFFSTNQKNYKYQIFLKNNFSHDQFLKKHEYLERVINQQNISLLKKVKLWINLFFQLNLTKEEYDLFMKANLLISKDNISNNQIILMKEQKHKIIISYKNLIYLYFLKKNNDINILEIIKQKEKNSKDTNITIETEDLMADNKSNKNDKQKTIKILSLELLKHISKHQNKDIVNKNVNIIINKYYPIFQLDLLLIYELIKPEILIRYHGNLIDTINQQIEYDLNELDKKEEIIYFLLDQIKFTININEYKQLLNIDKNKLIKINKTFKQEKKHLANNYIETMSLLLLIEIHQKQKTKEYRELYLYRNKVMHFQYNKITKEEIEKINLQISKILNQKEIKGKAQINEDQFFGLLTINIESWNKQIKKEQLSFI